MGILSWLKRKPEEPTTEDSTPVPCLHTALTAHWDSPADMGKEDLATSFRCSGCGETFNAAEARTLRETETERVRQALAR